MRAVLQRVSEAKVTSEGTTLAVQKEGLLILLGITENDSKADLDWLARKVAGMRIFEDTNGKMNHSIREIDGEITVVSQFTLFASTKKGNRPSFLNAAQPKTAQPLYLEFCEMLSEIIGKPVGRGKFGAMMEVTLVNDGPVTIALDSQKKE